MLDYLAELAQNPGNRRVLYGVAVFLLLVAWLLRRLGRRKLVSIGGANTGIAVNGDVHGSITQMGSGAVGTRDADAGKTGRAGRVLGILANLSTILALLLAAATFYLDHLT